MFCRVFFFLRKPLYCHVNWQQLHTSDNTSHTFNTKAQKQLNIAAERYKATLIINENYLCNPEGNNLTPNSTFNHLEEIL